MICVHLLACTKAILSFKQVVFTVYSSILTTGEIGEHENRDNDIFRDQCITVRQQTVRYPFVNSSALFQCTFFPYITIVTFFMLHFFDVVLFSCCTSFVLHSFCCLLVKLHYCHVAHFSSSTLFMLHLFKCCAFYILHPFFALFHVALISCCNVLRCTRFVMHFFHVALFLYCPLFVLHISVFHFFHLALFSSRDHP